MDRNILILGGSEPSNMQWCNDVASYVRVKGFEASFLPYENWEVTANFDYALEEIRLGTHLKGPYDAIIAKSVGTLLALDHIKTFPTEDEGFIDSSLLLFGIPLDYASKKGVYVGRRLRDINDIVNFVTVVQQENDFMGSFEDLERLRVNASAVGIESIMVSGSNHEYDFYDQSIKDEVDRFISSL